MSNVISHYVSTGDEHSTVAAAGLVVHFGICSQHPLPYPVVSTFTSGGSTQAQGQRCQPESGGPTDCSWQEG